MRNILIITVLFSTLVFTSFIKNKTRSLEKNLESLNKEIAAIDSNLVEASLDFEYLTTPQNISFLAKNFLDNDFSFYKNYQIKKTKIKNNNYILGNKIIREHDDQRFDIENKKNTKNFLITKNQYSEELIIKKNNKKFISKISKKEKKNSKNKIERWVGIQVLKTFLGIPPIPVK